MSKKQDQLLVYLLQGYIPMEEFSQHTLFYHYILYHELIKLSESKDTITITKSFAVRGKNHHGFTAGDEWVTDTFKDYLIRIFDIEKGTTFWKDKQTWNKI